MKSDSFLGASWNHLFKGPPVKSVVIVLLLFQKKASKQLLHVSDLANLAGILNDIL
jgi:hypothetical protein